MVIILFAQGREREERGERGLIKNKLAKLTTYTETYFQNEGEKRGKRKVADQSPKAKSEDTGRGKKKTSKNVQ